MGRAGLDRAGSGEGQLASTLRSKIWRAGLDCCGSGQG